MTSIDWMRTAATHRATRDAEILRRAAAGESERAIARALDCSRSTVWAVKQKALASG